MVSLPEHSFNLNDPDSRRIASFQLEGAIYEDMKVYANPSACAILDSNPNYVFQKDDVLWVERSEDWYALQHYQNRPAIIFDKEVNLFHPPFMNRHPLWP